MNLVGVQRGKSSDGVMNPDSCSEREDRMPDNIAVPKVPKEYSSQRRLEEKYGMGCTYLPHPRTVKVMPTSLESGT